MLADKANAISTSSVAWYLLGTIVSQGVSLKIFITLYKHLKISNSQRMLLSIPAVVTKNAGRNLVPGSIRIRQHLLLQFNLLHVSDISKTRHQLN